MSAPRRIIGNTGLDQQSGMIMEEGLVELRGQEGIRVFKEMRDQDPVVGAVLFSIEMLIRQVKWTFKPADTSAESKAIAEFFETALDDMESTWESVLSEILSFLPFGWSYLEVVYKPRFGPNSDPILDSNYNDGLIGWADWSIRSQDSLSKWEFGPNNRINGMWQRTLPNYKEVFIPRTKALHFKTTKQKNNPEGKSILRNAYRAYYFKKHMENMEGIGAERDLAGLPIIYAPAEIFDADNRDSAQTSIYNALIDIVKSVKNNENAGIVMPTSLNEQGHKEYQFELIASPGQRQFETGNIIERWDTRILMSVLADFIMLGHDSIGSFALSSDKTNLFGLAITSWLDIIESEINNHAIKVLGRMNGFPIERLPVLEAGDIETVNLAELGTYIRELALAGFILNDPETEEWVRKQGGMPISREDF